MGTIELENMEFFAYHGCYKQEQMIGNYFLVDVKFDYDCSKAIESDNLNDAVNYLKIYETVRGEMLKPSNLIEHVAGRIIDSLYAVFPEKILNITVKVRKMNPSLGGKLSNVSVLLTRGC